MSGLTQPWHIVLILLLALMFFGGKRLPEVGRSLGSGMREFKDSLLGRGGDDDDSAPSTPVTQDRQPPQQLPAAEQEQVRQAPVPEAGVAVGSATERETV